MGDGEARVNAPRGARRRLPDSHADSDSTSGRSSKLFRNESGCGRRSGWERGADPSGGEVEAERCYCVLEAGVDREREFKGQGLNQVRLVIEDVDVVPRCAQLQVEVRGFSCTVRRRRSG